jgi:hypothetical protein
LHLEGHTNPDGIREGTWLEIFRSRATVTP